MGKLIAYINIGTLLAVALFMANAQAGAKLDNTFTIAYRGK